MPRLLGYLQRATINISTATSTTLVAGVAGKTTRVFSILLVSASSQVLNLKNGSTSMTGDMTLTTLALDPIAYGNPRFECADGANLVLTSGAAVQLSGSVWYTQD